MRSEDFMAVDMYCSHLGYGQNLGGIYTLRKQIPPIRWLLPTKLFDVIIPKTIV
jgi:hypothetical protein